MPTKQKNTTNTKKKAIKQNQAEIERDNERAIKLTEGFKQITKELKSMPF